MVVAAEAGLFVVAAGTAVVTGTEVVAGTAVVAGATVVELVFAGATGAAVESLSALAVLTRELPLSAPGTSL